MSEELFHLSTAYNHGWHLPGWQLFCTLTCDCALLLYAVAPMILCIVYYHSHGECLCHCTVCLIRAQSGCAEVFSVLLCVVRSMPCLSTGCWRLLTANQLLVWLMTLLLYIIDSPPWCRKFRSALTLTTVSWNAVLLLC